MRYQKLRARCMKQLFKNKKTTMMGLGLLGRGINVAKFLIKHGAKLTITDLKPKERLTSSLKELAPYKRQIIYVLGEHRLEDFRNCDLVIKAAGVPLDNPFIEEAHKNGVPVEMDASLFARLAPMGVTLVGITGTRGKSTTTHLIAHVLRAARKKVYLGGNVRGLATLPLLEVVKKGDYVVLELDSWQLQGFGEAKISPQVAIFTNLLSDHMNYYKDDMERYFADKANIFLFQKKGDTLVAGRQVAKKIKKQPGKMVVIGAEDFPKGWRLRLEGEHNRFNAALAVAAARAMGIGERVIKKAVESFDAVEGRLQFVGLKNGVKIYNDNNATTPEATIAGLTALARGKNIVLIMGGADKGLVMDALIEEIKRSCRVVLFLSGTGTEKIKAQVKAILGLLVDEDERLEELVRRAARQARKGEVILFSPAFASFSKYFENEYERNDLFMKEVKKWLK